MVKDPRKGEYYIEKLGDTRSGYSFHVYSAVDHDPVAFFDYEKDAEWWIKCVEMFRHGGPGTQLLNEIVRLTQQETWKRRNCRCDYGQKLVDKFEDVFDKPYPRCPKCCIEDLLPEVLEMVPEVAEVSFNDIGNTFDELHPKPFCGRSDCFNVWPHEHESEST